jgi:hypothetical protein
MAADRLAKTTAPARSLVEVGRPDELIRMPGQVSRLIASWLREKAGIGGWGPNLEGLRRRPSGC